MSENIQSIANGSFVLGNTSATNFVGGTGIKVDSPSEGTVRISNDETVLWSGGTTGTKSAVLSETISNFKWLKVRMDDDHHGGRWVTVDTTEPWCKWISNYGYDMWNTANTNIGFREIGFSANGTNIVSITGFQKAVGWDSTAWNGSHQTGQYGGIVKVIGINRISGGNA